MKPSQLKKIADYTFPTRLIEASRHKHLTAECYRITITNHEGGIHYINDIFCKISYYIVEQLIKLNHRKSILGYHLKSNYVCQPDQTKN